MTGGPLIFRKNSLSIIFNRLVTIYEINIVRTIFRLRYETQYFSYNFFNFCERDISSSGMLLIPLNRFVPFESHLSFSSHL